MKKEHFDHSNIPAIWPANFCSVDLKHILIQQSISRSVMRTMQYRNASCSIAKYICYLKCLILALWCSRLF